MSQYVELQVTSNFSFLRGGSHANELFWQAHNLGYTALGMCDRNTLAGVVRGYCASREVQKNDKGEDVRCQVRQIVGARLDLQDGPSLLVYPTNRSGYAQLSQLLTLGKMRDRKNRGCYLSRQDVYDHAEDWKIIALSEDEQELREYKDAFGRDLYVAATHRYHGDDERRLAQLARLAQKLRLPLIATNDVHYHAPERRPLQDVLTCIREKCTIDDAGLRLHANAERHLKSQAEMQRLYKKYPDALKRTLEIAEACTFSLDELKYEYPEEIVPAGSTPQQHLEKLTWEGAQERWPEGVPERHRAQIEKELFFINEKEYAPFFLTVDDVVRFARKNDILCQGRGSAANSIVCYCLGISSVDPDEVSLLFERFISASRNEPPDIDVDFEHERREDVMQYIFEKYGRERAGIVATVVEYRQKGALRDVGKAMGLSVDTIMSLSHLLWYGEWISEEVVRSQGLDPTDIRLRQTIYLAHQLLGFPRHLSQHTGGFVITRTKLGDLCPVMWAAMDDRSCIEWNKDDIDALRMMKIDVLALGMLTALQKCLTLLRQHHGISHTLASIEGDDEPTYDMICRADTIGVFQIESRAQMTMLPRLKPRKYYDLVIEVAIVRPGPIQGDMVHPYLRRRNKEEKVEYPSPELENILHKTLGVPLFQEQAMNIAIVAAGFSPSDADKLRRSMATFKAVGDIHLFESKLKDGMKARGYPDDYAHRLFMQLEGFGSYGFPESHAASFALLVYVSAWLKCHYPDVFCCALLNSQPMGFYSPAQLVRDAREHAVDIRPVDVNLSQWDNTLLEKDGRYCPIQLGFREVHGLPAKEIERLIDHRGDGYGDIAGLWRRASLSISTLETLARADAFRLLGLPRREALWQVAALAARPSALLGRAADEAVMEEAVTLPAMRLSEHVMQDYASQSFSLKAHPMQFLRPRLEKLEGITHAALAQARPNGFVRVAGLVLMRQRPPTAGGIMFLTLEDETGVANIVIFTKIFEGFRKAILGSRLLMVEGKLEREGEVIHVIAKRLHDVSPWLKDLSTPDLPQLAAPKRPRVQGDLFAGAEVIPRARHG